MTEQERDDGRGSRDLALITGASAGLGEEFAHQLASKGYDLMIVARRLDRLQRIATELEAGYDIKVYPLAADLSDRGSIGFIEQAVRDRGREVSFLVTNAGFGSTGAVLDRTPKFWEDMMQVNMNSLVSTVNAFLPSMVRQKRGTILAVASTAAFQPIPWFTVYAATKAFVLRFTEGLAREVRQHNITVSCLCPGPTRTEFTQAASIDVSRLPAFIWMDSGTVVAEALRAVDQGQIVCVPGLMNKLMISAEALVPNWFISELSGVIYRKFI